jgi:hypothetical protein
MSEDTNSRAKQADSVVEAAYARVPVNRPPCGALAYLGGALVPLALEVAGGEPHTADDVLRHLRCELERGHEGPHHGLVLNLDGVETGSVWTRWGAGISPQDVVVLADCDGASEDGMEACAEYAGHPGGHTWELDGSWRAARP